MRVKLLLLFFAFSFLFKTDNSFDQDLGRHLKLGEIIWQSHNVPKTNLFSYTNPGFPFINTHWLFEVWVFLTAQGAGLNSLLIFKIFIILFAVWVTLKTTPKTNRALLLPLGFVFLHVLRSRTELRPEIFSFAFTACTYYILEKNFQKPSKLIFLLPLIQLLWVNTHIYFFIGLTLQLIYIVSLVILIPPKAGEGSINLFKSNIKPKTLPLLIFLLSLLASLANPNFISGAIYPLNVGKNYGYTIVENQTMFLLEKLNFYDRDFLFAKICLVLTAISLQIILVKRRFNLKNFTLVFFGLSLALINVRSFPYLFFICLPALLQIIGPIGSRGKIYQAAFVLFGGLLILESYFYLNGDYYKYTGLSRKVSLSFVEAGKPAMDFLINNNLPGPLFNNFDIGSYIIYRGYPKYPVFVDGRPEAYPRDFFLNTYIPTQYDFGKFVDLQKTLGIKTVIFSHTDQTPWAKIFLHNLSSQPDWSLVYLDDFMVIFAKKQLAQEKKISPINLAELDPSNFAYQDYLQFYKIAVFLLNNGQIESAKKFLTKSLSLFGDSPPVNLLMANLSGQPVFLIKAKNIFFW